MTPASFSPSSRPPIGFHELARPRICTRRSRRSSSSRLSSRKLRSAAMREARNRPWIGSVTSRWVSSWLIVVSRRVAPGLPITNTTSPARTPSLPHPKYAGVRAGCPSGP